MDKTVDVTVLRTKWLNFAKKKYLKQFNKVSVFLVKKYVFQFFGAFSDKVISVPISRWGV
jgi:hypothetical protein